MANFDKNEAYDLSLFAPREVKEAPGQNNRKAAAKPELVKAKPKTAQEIHLEKKYRRQKLIKMSFVCGVLLFLFCSVLQSRVEISKLAVIQAKETTSLETAISESVRLKSVMEKKYSYDQVQAFVKLNRMQKIEKITYINTEKEDKVLICAGKPAE